MYGSYLCVGVFLDDSKVWLFAYFNAMCIVKNVTFRKAPEILVSTATIFILSACSGTAVTGRC
jgi:hypothetical protein